MRQILGTALPVLIPLVLSPFLALLTLIYSILPSNLSLLLALLSLSLLTLGVYGWLMSSRYYFAWSVGGQLIWSCCSLALQDASILLVWTMFFVQIALLFVGIKAVWIWSYPGIRMSRRVWKPLGTNLITISEWLGATAILSAAILLVVPLFGSSLNLLLLAALFVVALISFFFLATRSVSGDESKRAEAKSEDLK